MWYKFGNLIIILFSGCATAQQKQLAMVNECRAMGFNEQTDAFGNCILQLRAIDQQKRAAIARALTSRPIYNPPVIQAPVFKTIPNNRINCNSYTMGNNTTTNCY